MTPDDRNAATCIHFVPPTPGDLIDPKSKLWRHVLAVHALAVEYKNGASLNTCAKAIGSHAFDLVRHHFKTAGIPRRPRGRPRGTYGMSPKMLARIEKVVALRRSGMTLAAIGRRFGTSRQRIHQMTTSPHRKGKP